MKVFFKRHHYQCLLAGLHMFIVKLFKNSFGTFVVFCKFKRVVKSLKNMKEVLSSAMPKSLYPSRTQQIYFIACFFGDFYLKSHIPKIGSGWVISNGRPISIIFSVNIYLRRIPNFTVLDAFF